MDGDVGDRMKGIEVNGNGGTKEELSTPSM